MRTGSAPRRRRVSLQLWVYRHRVVILATVGAVLLSSLAVLAHFTSVVVKRFEGHRWNLPSRIYSDMFELFPRDFRYPGKFFRGFPARIEFASGKVASIRDSSGEPSPALVVEPELLGSVFGEEFQDRTLVRLEDLPQSLKDAVLVTEDRDFYRHAGVSIRRSLGAILSNVKRRAMQGGSTLTQQLVKNLYLSPERTLRRKAIEAVLAVILDARYSKDEIFEAYMNEIYLGQYGSVAVNGVGEAARHYFGKEASDLDLAESATIAAMIKAPNAYSPLHNPVRARQRRDLVLKVMREEKKLDDAALAQAHHKPVVPI